MNRPSVVVVGGGIVGCMTAMQLQQRGYRVTVVERNLIAAQTSGESSWAGAGIIFPLLPWLYQPVVNHLALAGAQAYPAICQRLWQDTGINPECVQSGMLIRPPFDLPAARAWAEQYQVAIQEIDDTLWIDSVLQVRNPRLLQALKAWLLLHEVTLLEHTQLMPLEESAHPLTRWQTTTGDWLEADVFVVTSGAWSFELLKQTAMQLEIKPMRGQMLLYHLPPNTLKHMLYHNGFYMLQRLDGHVLAGSSLEDVGFDTGVTAHMRAEMQAKAEALCPALKQAPILQHWSGLRPGTPHNIPTIGRHPNIENLFLNTGHFRYGVTMAPACASQVVALVDAYVEGDEDIC